MIPLRYNTRNLVVRWKTTLLTALGFTLVVSLLVVMLAFVQGLQILIENAGRPGNVLVLRDGVNDELMSDIGRNEPVFELWSQPEVLRESDGTPIVSKEVYCIGTQELPGANPGDPAVTHFLGIRGVEDPVLSGKVHGLVVKEPGRWFDESGSEVVIGEGMAKTLGVKVGDSFPTKPGLTWKVVGILDSAGSAFNSEIWAKLDVVGREFGKDSADQRFYTTIILATDSDETATEFAKVLQSRTPNLRINAMPEKKYYSEMGKINQVLLVSAIWVAFIMAGGGLFGLMNTMFAAVSQRIKDIGVLRVLGYRGWQILLSFLFESLLIATVGGAVGLLIGSTVHGIEQWGVLSSGMGSFGKAVVFRMTVDAHVIMIAVSFTLAIGVLGGILPAWTAMRLKVLDALR